MVLVKRDEQEFGDDQADLQEYLRQYSVGVGYVAERFADVVCTCSNRTFRLALDDAQGAAVRTCTACGAVHPIGDSADYLKEAQLEECACPCSNEGLELTVGVALYRGSDDVKWFYVGARCPLCRLTGCYGDWKNDSPGYRELLARA